jgi:Holliday junction resolvasome RuvABC endonuclease subunit
MKRILGFDVSSSAIGYCVLEIDDFTGQIKFISMDYLLPSKKGNIIDRIVDTRNKLNDIINKIGPDYIGIEDLIKFMPKSTATTVVVLATFNRMVCLLAYDYLQKQPELLNVMSIRHGLKTNKVLPKKEEMPELVAKHLGINFPYLKSKSKITKKGKKIEGKIKAESFDMADGVAVALYYAFILTGRVQRKVKKK